MVNPSRLSFALAVVSTIASLACSASHAQTAAPKEPSGEAAATAKSQKASASKTTKPQAKDEPSPPLPSPKKEAKYPPEVLKADEMLKAGSDLETAEKIYEDALETAPKDPALWIRLGNCLSMQQKYFEAASAFEMALQFKSPANEAVISSLIMLSLSEPDLGLNAQRYIEYYLALESSAAHRIKLSHRVLELGSNNCEYAEIMLQDWTSKNTAQLSTAQLSTLNSDRFRLLAYCAEAAGQQEKAQHLQESSLHCGDLDLDSYP